LVIKQAEVESDPNQWTVRFFAPRDDSYNIFNAPAFAYFFAPEGYHPNTDVPYIAVTYGLNGFDEGMKTNGDFDYAIRNEVYCDPDVGYQVFHLNYLSGRTTGG
jgi:hypothetical protein